MHQDSPPPAPTGAAAPPRILVWDLPVRAFHWLMVLSFAGAWISADSERWRLLHISLGYTLGGLVAFRLLWGVVGSRHARFGSFVRGPRAVLRYLRAMLHGRPEHHVGHNPAGAVAIVAMLGLGALIVGSGWALYNDLGGELLEDLHETAAELMMAVVVVHVLGVLLASWLHRENLVRSMLNGRKAALPQDGIPSAWRSVAVLMVAAVVGFWAWQWQGAPGASAGSAMGAEGSQGTASATPRRDDHGGDDDHDHDRRRGKHD